MRSASASENQAEEKTASHGTGEASSEARPKEARASLRWANAGESKSFYSPSSGSPSRGPAKRWSRDDLASHAATTRMMKAASTSLAWSAPSFGTITPDYLVVFGCHSMTRIDLRSVDTTEANPLSTTFVGSQVARSRLAEAVSGVRRRNSEAALRLGVAAQRNGSLMGHPLFDPIHF